MRVPESQLQPALHLLLQSQECSLQEANEMLGFNRSRSPLPTCLLPLASKLHLLFLPTESVLLH